MDKGFDIRVNKFKAFDKAEKKNEKKWYVDNVALKI
jgi:hypothetical protein